MNEALIKIAGMAHLAANACDNPPPAKNGPRDAFRMIEDVARAALASAPAATEPTDPEGVAIDFNQAAQLLEMFGNAQSEITLTKCEGHSGQGLYAHFTEYPEDGSWFLGATDQHAPINGSRIAAPTQDTAPARALLSEQDATLLNQALEMLEELSRDARAKGNDSEAEGAACSAHAVLRLAAARSQASEAAAPKDSEIATLANEIGVHGSGRGIKAHAQLVSFAKEVLARWGALPPTAPQRGDLVPMYGWAAQAGEMVVPAAAAFQAIAQAAQPAAGAVPVAWEYRNDHGRAFLTHEDPNKWHPHDQAGFKDFRALAYATPPTAQPAEQAGDAT